jgi:methionyl aminopeptidase
MISILSGSQVSDLKKSGSILAFAMKKVEEAVKIGTKTKELDQIAEAEIYRAGAIPAFKNYIIEGSGAYPASLCVSVNHHVVHGIPGEYVLQDGDIISLDLGASFNGIFSDMAVTLPVGRITKKAEKLITVTKECLEIGIAQAHIGNKIGAIGCSIQKQAEKNGFGVIRDLVGHGVGLKPHMEPKIPNFGSKNFGEDIVNGLTIAIEPMITAGDFRVKLEKDNWTIPTKDLSLSAHFEHTIIVEKGEAKIVTIS